MLDEQGEIGMSVRNSKVGMSRRTLLKAGAAISVFPAPRVFAQSSEPLKIGFLTVLTGPLAAGGKQQEEGAALFLKERNGMIGSRKVVADYSGYDRQSGACQNQAPRVGRAAQSGGVDRPAGYQR